MRRLGVLFLLLLGACGAPSSETRRLIEIAAGQSNEAGDDSALSGAPADHGRHDARTWKMDAAGAVVPALEPLHEGLEPYLKPGDGFASPKVGTNLWLDEHPDAEVLIIPCALGSTDLGPGGAWRTPPDGIQGTRAAFCAARSIAQIRADDAVVLHWYQGERDAALATNQSTYAQSAQAWFDWLRTQLRRPEMPIIIHRLPSPGWSNAMPSAWSSVQAQQDSLARPNQIVLRHPNETLTALHLSPPDHVAWGRLDGAALLRLFP